MARLDVRVRTGLQVWITHHESETESVAKVTELSLSGLLIAGWTTKIPCTFLITH